MEKLFGKTSDRIRRGEIDESAVFPAKRPGAMPPSADSIRTGSGQALGDASRSHPSARTSED